MKIKEQHTKLLGNTESSTKRKVNCTKSLHKEIGEMKFDWNISPYCITPLKFNDSKYNWEKVKMHLLGHPNYSQKIYDLEQQITEIFSRKLPKITGMDVINSR